jgi:RNA polymerase sigma-70 factor (ECF subfamily)
LADKDATFARLITPHLEAAYSLARWLTGNEADAADVLQDAALRAFRFISGLRSEDAKAWFFQIVRNSAYTLLRGRRIFADVEEESELADEAPNAEALLLERSGARELQAAMERLPERDREILVLRELEDFSYEQIAQILEVPAGTVMSRLARARARLRRQLLSAGTEV